MKPPQSLWTVLWVIKIWSRALSMVPKSGPAPIRSHILDSGVTGPLRFTGRQSQPMVRSSPWQWNIGPGRDNVFSLSAQMWPPPHFFLDWVKISSAYVCWCSSSSFPLLALKCKVIETLDQTATPSPPISNGLCVPHNQRWRRSAYIPTPAPYFYTLYNDYHGDFKVNVAVNITKAAYHLNAIVLPELGGDGRQDSQRGQGATNWLLGQVCGSPGGRALDPDPSADTAGGHVLQHPSPRLRQLSPGCAVRCEHRG